MAKYQHQIYQNQNVTLDGNEYEGCTFEGCTLEYQGLKPVSLTGSTMNNCQWSFKGPAANAVQFMGAMYRSGSAGALLIESTFNQIRGLTSAQGGPANQVARTVN